MRIVFLLAFLLSNISFAAIRPYYQDIKLPTQKMVEQQALANLAAADSVTLLTADAGNSSAAEAVVSSFSAQPDVARILRIHPGGSTGDVAACAIVVVGTDYLGNALTETLTTVANQSTALDGLKAFKTVTSVTFPAACEDAPYQATWYLGVGESIGLKRCLDQPGHFFHSTLNGAKEATAPTMSADASVVALNKADFNGTMNGSNDFELFFMQNFRCVR